MKLRSKPKPIATGWELYGTGSNCGVTKSLLETFLTCPEKLRLGYRERLGPKRNSDAIEFGNIFHAMLDLLYTECRDHPDTLDWAEDFIREQIRLATSSLPLIDEQLDRLYGLAEVTLVEYAKYWESDYRETDWIALEEKFAVPYIPDNSRNGVITLRGKADGRFRLKSGEVWLFETKTKGRIEELAILDRMPYEIQIQMYLLALEKQTGQALSGVRYNVVRRSALKQNKSESLYEYLQRVKTDIQARPEWYFVRYDCQIEAQERRDWYREFQAIMWRLQQWWEGRGHYKDSLACTGQLGRCQFLGLCGREDMDGLARREAVFPELDL